MPNRIFMISALAVVLSVFAGTQAFADKSSDTLRFAITEPYRSMSPYHYPATEASLVNRAVFQTLIGMDERTKKFYPVIAKSWKRINDTTVELEIFDDIKFHSGNKLTADDVIYTLNYSSDPKVKFRFKSRYTWIKRVEKLGPYKLRVVAKKLRSTDLMHFAFRIVVVDSKIHAAYKDRTEYGRKTPIGSGPYRVTKFNRNEGVTLERWAGFKKNRYERAPIKTIKMRFIPDRQTQMAQLLTGSVDLIFNVSVENAKALRANPKMGVTAMDALTFLYFTLDALGRAGNDALKDIRVRKAIFMAVDREKIIKFMLPGGEVATRINAMCFKSMLACHYTTKPPSFDPAAAKKLLAAAGYPNGFNLVIDAQLRSRDIGEAITGMLRNVGIKASVKPITTTVLFKRWSGGKLAALVNNVPAGIWPDASRFLDINFGNIKRDSVRDPIIRNAQKAGHRTHDLAKRKAIYQRAFDRMNELYTHLPISSKPRNWGHSKEVRIEPNPHSLSENIVSDMFWN